MGKKSVPVVFCGDANYGTYLPVVVQSIIEHASEQYHYHIIVFDCGIDRDICAAFAAQLAPYPHFSYEIKDISILLEKHRENFRERLHYTRAMYGRLFIPELCSEYERVIYSDIDVVFERDIAELMEIDLGGNYIAAVTELAVEFERRVNKKFGVYIETQLQLAADMPCIYSGLLVFNRKAWHDCNLTGKIISFLEGKKLRCPDQDAITAVCKGKITYLRQGWTCVILKDRIKRFARHIKKGSAPKLEALLGEWEEACRSNHAVVHYNGAVKPWHSLHVFLGEKWWYYARKTAIYPHYNHILIKDIARRKFPVKTYRIFGIPLLTVKTTPREKKYFIGKFRIAKKTYGEKECFFYFFGMKLFSVSGDG